MGKKKGAGCVSRKATVRESLQASNRDWGIWRWRIRWSEEEWVEWRKECGSGGIWVEEWEVWEQAWADWRAAMKEMVDAHEALVRKEKEKQRPEQYYKNHVFRPRQAFKHTKQSHFVRLQQEETQAKEKEETAKKMEEKKRKLQEERDVRRGGSMRRLLSCNLLLC
jgi:hypothetical protein